MKIGKISVILDSEDGLKILSGFADIVSETDKRYTVDTTRQFWIDSPISKSSLMKPFTIFRDDSRISRSIVFLENDFDAAKKLIAKEITDAVTELKRRSDAIFSAWENRTKA